MNGLQQPTGEWSRCAPITPSHPIPSSVFRWSLPTSHLFCSLQQLNNEVNHWSLLSIDRSEEKRGVEGEADREKLRNVTTRKITVRQYHQTPPAISTQQLNRSGPTILLDVGGAGRVKIIPYNVYYGTGNVTSADRLIVYYRCRRRLIEFSTDRDYIAYSKDWEL